jgi:hypothetical protein
MDIANLKRNYDVLFSEASQGGAVIG